MPDAPEPSSESSDGAVTLASSVAFVTDVPDFRPTCSVSPETPTSRESTKLSSMRTDTASELPVETVTVNEPDTSSLEKDVTGIERVTTCPDPLIV